MGADNTLADFFADGNAQTVFRRAVFDDIHHQTAIGKRSALMIYIAKLKILFQGLCKKHGHPAPFPICLKKFFPMTNKRPHSAALIYSWYHRKLCRQYFSAFSSSCSQHFSAVCSSHSFSEAVFSASLSFLGLKCHFHCTCTSFVLAGF